MKTIKLICVCLLGIAVVMLFFTAAFHSDNITFQIYDTYIIVPYKLIVSSLITITGLVFLFNILFKANRQKKV
jgi:hypothetical protein